MNYNKWFYEQHRYLTGIRNGKESYNDTKAIDVGERYKTLIDMSSQLLSEQPFGVVGNNAGFDRLIDLMSRSNYTFEDINQSLIETYDISLKNAMSSMLVNTHAVMFHCNNMDRDHVYMDKSAHYYMIDVPFNQLHFGDRDEFIRQKLCKMHTTVNEYFIPINEFVMSDISDILGFTILCTVNGFICNDCMIAIDDKGFKFKIGWKYSADVDFIIYKLDESLVRSYDIDSSYILEGEIPFSQLNNLNDNINVSDMKCLINIYNKDFSKTVPSVPNYGIFNGSGLSINNIQKRTLDDISHYKSKTVTVVIYIFRYLHEVPNVYPACNYYDIIDSRHVFTDDENRVVDVDGNKIVASSANNINALEVCTPPIVLDRPINLSFKIILNCLDMYNRMIKYDSSFRNIGSAIHYNSLDDNQLYEDIIYPLNDIYDDLLKCYNDYLQGSILTSLVPNESIALFATLLDNIDKLRKVTSTTDLQKYVINEFYDNNYQIFVNTITKPFRNNTLANFANLSNLSNNYFVNENFTRFNRPVAEQCFITMQYSRTEECWLFASPLIKHFNGIQNAFYIDENLTGDEIFKFFVLYTDTKSPIEKDVNPFDMNTVLDFDAFYSEVNNHIGYIRYWYAENKLLKISKMLYNKYDGETCTQVLSKILKRKISGDDIIDIYPSDINYEVSNITSDNIHAGEDDDRAPFAINFLYYTLSMLYDNEDRLQSFFLNSLTHNKFSNRYSDICISQLFDGKDSFDIDYSQFSLAPNTIDIDSSKLPEISGQYMFYGLPIITDNTGTSTIKSLYRYTFNSYDNNISYPLIADADIDKQYFVQYKDISSHGYQTKSYHNDIYIAKLIMSYISSVYDYISDLQTNYNISYNQRSRIESGIETLQKHIYAIAKYYHDHETSFEYYTISNIVESIITNNPIISLFNDMTSKIDTISTCTFNGKTISVIIFFNRILSILKQIYINKGFDNYILDYARKIYLTLKKINTCMNPYQYKQWLNSIDSELIKNLGNAISNSTIIIDSINAETFDQLSQSCKAYQDTRIPVIDDMINLLASLTTSLHYSHIVPLVKYCDSIFKKYIFSMYTLDRITYDSQLSYQVKPIFASITLPRDSHFYPPVGTSLIGDITMIFKPTVELIDGKYYINSLIKICEYAFFNGDSISGCKLNIIDATGNTIETIDCSLTFSKVSSSATVVGKFKQILNISNIKIDIENIHESFDINPDGLIVNKKSSNMNYEMLAGNHFTQLDHTSEMILQPKSLLPGSIDRIFINNQTINGIINQEFGKNVSKKIFFKPVQVFHIPFNENGSITSIGSRYHVGQHVYVSTDDKRYIFPIIITAIDHSINKGFVEAIVDSKKCKWFSIDDEDEITRYLTTNIKCSIIADNISNFLDEYNDTSFNTYSNSLANINVDISDENVKDAYSVPGDPIYVQNNMPYVYTRLQWIFNSLVPNNIIDDEHKQHRFIYIGNGCINNIDDEITIKMINHNFDTMTNPEKYPILREEPNDHAVRDQEIETFEQYKSSSEAKIPGFERALVLYKEQLERATTDYERERIINQIDSIQRGKEHEIEFQKRMDSYIKQLESPTTWYNVRAYEDALVYIANGRAKLSHSFMSNIGDIPFTDKLELYIYDWEHKCWINPNMYSVSTNMVNAVKIDECDSYSTNNVLHSISIIPKSGFVPSKELLIYISYKSSKVFDDIYSSSNICDVRFKSVYSLNDITSSANPYDNIRIRKHFDCNESYIFDSYNPPTDISIANSFHIIRPRRTGKYTNAPVIRLCDVSIYNNDVIYDFTKFDMYVRLPFKDVTSTMQFKIPKYDVTINQPIDSFIHGRTIKLLCIQNNESSAYDGNIGNIMFEAVTALIDDKQIISITNSSMDKVVAGEFICTVFKDDMYKTCGGIITVKISFDKENLIDDKGAWMRIPSSLAIHKEIPNECIFVLHDDNTIDTSKQTKIIFNNKYEKTSSDVVMINNSAIFNPFEYYFDTKNKIRLPLSDIRRNSHTNRLVINTSINPDVKLIKSNYIGICRYSAHIIPENGFIDVTGYIPTPLSRDRYEFWINGRYINNSKDLIILSPTTLQLCNLRSLHNFELVELVDDMKDSNIIRKGNVYVDLNGKAFSSYKLALLSNSNITKQDIRYMFNANQHHPIQDYIGNIISDTNNRDIEDDILMGLSYDNPEGSIDYNTLYNIPSINGISLNHETVQSLGLVDIPNIDIIKLFDNTWRYEETTNPLFLTTHRDRMELINNQHIKLNVRSDTNDFVIFASGFSSRYFTLYISKKSDGNIDDIDNTVKIISFIKTGVYVIIDKSYNGMWLHSTFPNTKPIRII